VDAYEKIETSVKVVACVPPLYVLLDQRKFLIAAMQTTFPFKGFFLPPFL
jgi:hypothetical protein